MTHLVPDLRRPPPLDRRQETLDRARERAHPNCMACGSSQGVRVRFNACDDGSVQAEFSGGTRYEGYSNYLHGGLIATLLDAAMTNCLFAHDMCAVTAELVIRYQRPVRADDSCHLRARLERQWGPLSVLSAELKQDGVLCVTASAKFMEAPGLCRVHPAALAKAGSGRFAQVAEGRPTKSWKTPRDVTARSREHGEPRRDE